MTANNYYCVRHTTMCVVFRSLLPRYHQHNCLDNYPITGLCLWFKLKSVTTGDWSWRYRSLVIMFHCDVNNIFLPGYPLCSRQNDWYCQPTHSPCAEMRSPTQHGSPLPLFSANLIIYAVVPKNKSSNRHLQRFQATFLWRLICINPQVIAIILSNKLSWWNRKQRLPNQSKMKTLVSSLSKACEEGGWK